MPCVLLITNDTLLGFTLKTVINPSLVGVLVIDSLAITIEELLKEIIDHEANVIVLEKSNLFAKQGVLKKIMMSSQKIKVIIVDEDSNWLQIFRRDDLLMTATTDLVDVIQSA